MRGEIKFTNWNGYAIDWIQESNMWPSNDLLDSPNDTFRCQRCRWEFRHATSGWWESGGVRRLDETTQEFFARALDSAKETARLHYESCCEYRTYPPKGMPILLHGEIPREALQLPPRIATFTGRIRAFLRSKFLFR